MNENNFKHTTHAHKTGLRKCHVKITPSVRSHSLPIINVMQSIVHQWPWKKKEKKKKKRDRRTACEKVLRCGAVATSQTECGG
jgi:hypothetical protein